MPEPNGFEHRRLTPSSRLPTTCPVLFEEILEAGLVERKQSKVNWDPVDHTVLANEQVIDGRGWRSGAEVQQRELTQWFFRISDYSEDLLKSLGRSTVGPTKCVHAEKLDRTLEGLLLRFALDPATAPNKEDDLEIFTTRPDTLFGAKFMALSRIIRWHRPRRRRIRNSPPYRTVPSHGHRPS